MVRRIALIVEIMLKLNVFAEKHPAFERYFFLVPNSVTTNCGSRIPLLVLTPCGRPSVPKGSVLEVVMVIPGK